MNSIEEAYISLDNLTKSLSTKEFELAIKISNKMSGIIGQKILFRF